MSTRPLHGVLVSTDAALRETVHAFSREAGGRLGIVLELAVPFAEFGGEQFKAVEGTAPALVLLDIDGSPEIGLSLAKALARASEHLMVVAVGGGPSTELLLEAMRAGVAEFLPKPVTAAHLTATVDRLGARLAPAQDGGPAGRTLAFFSPKGGAGVTTAATNLAIGVHQATGRKTLLVDLDPELGEISLLLGVQPQFNFVDLVQNFHRMDSSLLATYIERHGSGVHLLSAPFHPDRAAAVTEDQVRKILLYLKGLYDYVLVDTSKSFAPTTVAAFEQADELWLIATADLPTLRNVQRALPLLRRVLPRGGEQLRLVINRYNPHDEITLKDVERTVTIPVFATLCNDYDAVIRSVNAGKPVLLNGPRSAYARDVRDLVARITGPGAGGGSRPGRGGGGVLGRLFRRRTGGPRP